MLSYVVFCGVSVISALFCFCCFVVFVVLLWLLAVFKFLQEWFLQICSLDSCHMSHVLENRLVCVHDQPPPVYQTGCCLSLLPCLNFFVLPHSLAIHSGISPAASMRRNFCCLTWLGLWSLHSCSSLGLLLGPPPSHSLLMLPPLCPSPQAQAQCPPSSFARFVLVLKVAWRVLALIWVAWAWTQLTSW